MSHPGAVAQGHCELPRGRPVPHNPCAWMHMQVCVVDEEPSFGPRRLPTSSVWEQAGGDIMLPDGNTSFSGACGLEVLCVGFVAVGMHTEYNFRVSHSCGCSWKVQRRYSSLLALHEELAARCKSLPPFPQKVSISQHLTSDRDVAVQRAAALQRYFQFLALRGDVLGMPAVLEALGAEKPDLVQSVRIMRWDHVGQAEVAVELDVQPSVQAENYHRPVEGIEVQIRIPAWLRHQGSSGRSADGTTFLAQVGKPVRIPLPPHDSEMELHVRAYNGLGSSAPVSIRVVAPTHQGYCCRGVCTAASPFPEFSDGEVRTATRTLGVGSRVEAMWAGDGHWYDAVVRHVDDAWGWVTVDWLRPRPLGGDHLRCVCDAGGDDTAHRRVLPIHVRLAGPLSRRIGRQTATATANAKDIKLGFRESI